MSSFYAQSHQNISIILGYRFKFTKQEFDEFAPLLFTEMTKYPVENYNTSIVNEMLNDYCRNLFLDYHPISYDAKGNIVFDIGLLCEEDRFEKKDSYEVDVSSLLVLVGQSLELEKTLSKHPLVWKYKVGDKPQLFGQLISTEQMGYME